MAYDAHVLRRLSLAILAAMLLGAGPFAASGTAAGGAPTAALTITENPGALPTLDWTLNGSSDQINVLPNLRCEMGPLDSWQFPKTDPCIWLVDHLAPLPPLTPAGCLAAREPGVGGPAPYASWRCDMRQFRDVVLRAARSNDSRSYVMFNTTASGGSGVCASIPITVLLGAGYGGLQAADGCPQTIRCDDTYRGAVGFDPGLDTVTNCPGTGGTGSGSGGSGSGGSGSGSGGSGSGTGGSGSAGGGGGGSGLPPAPGSGSGTKKQAGGATSGAGKGSSCPGASSGTKGDSPLYSVYIKARGKRGMKIYVHMRRAVPITVDVRMRRNGRTPKVVRWVSRCAKKGTNLITLPNATGGAQNRRNYRVYVKSPNSTYPLRSSWEALPRR